MTLGDAVRPGLPAGVAAPLPSPPGCRPRLPLLLVPWACRWPGSEGQERDRTRTPRLPYAVLEHVPLREGEDIQERAERARDGRTLEVNVTPPSRASSALKAALQRSVAPAGGLPGAQGLGDGAALSLLSQVPQSPCPRQAVGSRERQTSAPRSGGGALRSRQTESSEWIPLSAAMHGGPQNSGQLGPRRSGCQWTAGRASRPGGETCQQWGQEPVCALWGCAH